MLSVSPRATLGRIFFTIFIKKSEKQWKVLRSSGKSDYPRDLPRANFSRQPLWTLHCLYHSCQYTVQYRLAAHLAPSDLQLVLPLTEGVATLQVKEVGWAVSSAVQSSAVGCEVCSTCVPEHPDVALDGPQGVGLDGDGRHGDQVEQAEDHPEAQRGLVQVVWVGGGVRTHYWGWGLITKVGGKTGGTQHHRERWRLGVPLLPSKLRRGRPWGRGGGEKGEGEEGRRGN